LIAQKKYEAAGALLQKLRETAEAGEYTARVIEIILLQALAYQAGDEPDQAITLLERALVLAESGGFIRIFVDEGPEMAQLLYDALNRGIAKECIQRIIAAFPNIELEEPVHLSAQIDQSVLIEPLSNREIDVLVLIAEGMTNPEIASRLYVALNTVKVHTRNIYGKLDVNNRTQAVTKARSLGILTTS
jgi:LuxR family maltose regulon positive regulatory protein